MHRGSLARLKGDGLGDNDGSAGAISSRAARAGSRTGVRASGASRADISATALTRRTSTASSGRGGSNSAGGARRAAADKVTAIGGNADAIRGAGGVGVVVAASRVVVSDLDILNVHRPRHASGSIVSRLAASPRDSALVVVRVTASPDTQADIHRGLREVGAAVSISIVQGADGCSVNGPDNRILGPVDGVGVDSVLRSGDGELLHPVVGRSVSLAEVISLDIAVVAAQELLLRISIHFQKEKSGRKTHTQSISSRSSDCRTMLLMIP